jgi:hypothetical protein
MPDLKIFLACVAWITIAAFMMAQASANFNVSNDGYVNASGIFSGTVNMSTQTNDTINFQNIRGEWTVDGNGLHAIELDWLSSHATCFFGSKILLNGVFSERIHLKGLQYNNTSIGYSQTDEISLNVYYTTNGGVELRIIADRLYYAWTPINIDNFASGVFSPRWYLTEICAIGDINGTIWLGYDYYINNQTTIVKVWRDSNTESNAYTVKFQDNRTLEEFRKTDDSLTDAFNTMYKQLNGTKLSRFDTNTKSVCIDYYSKYVNVDTDTGLKAYNLQNYQNIYDNLLAALTFQVDSRIIPLEYQLFLIGLPYIILAAWIIVLLRGA